MGSTYADQREERVIAMKLNHMDLIVADVPAAAEFFRDVVGLDLKESGERFAHLEPGQVSLMLSPDAMVPQGPQRM